VNDQTDQTVRFSDPTYFVALLSSRKTDLLLARIREWPVGLNASPTTAEARAAWYSFAFFLRAAATARLDIDPSELDAGFRAFSGASGADAEVFLADQLENGAGYATALAEPEWFSDLLDQADPSQKDSLGQTWLGDAHATNFDTRCDSSCHRCLRDYGNMPYHGLLDWRLALDMARIAQSTTAEVSLAQRWEFGIPNPWTSLVEGDHSPIAQTLRKLGWDGPHELGDLIAFRRAASRRLLVLRHPLWSDDHPTWKDVTEIARERSDFREHRIRAGNPFRILRAPAFYESGW
jgi:hypothetical protein